MNLKRFTARSSREALALVRQAFGDDAVVMSTRPCAEGVEVLAMAPESLQQIERVGAQAATFRPAEPARTAAPRQAAAPRAPAFPSERAPERAPERASQRTAASSASRVEPRWEPAAPSEREEVLPTPQGLGARSTSQDDLRQEVEQDVEQLQMSTLSFQDYVRERMLRRRDAELQAQAHAASAQAAVVSPIEAARARHAARQADAPMTPAAASRAPRSEPPVLREEITAPAPRVAQPAAEPAARRVHWAGAEGASRQAAGVPRRAEPARAAAPQPPARTAADARHHGPLDPAEPAEQAEQAAMMSELRSMRGLIEQRFSALAFMEKLQRQPRQAALSQRLLDGGFSPALIRRLVQSLPNDIDEGTWAANVLERNLATGEREPALEDVGGVFAVIGATGVGKTTSTAKLAAAFATKHGAANLGLITLDAYRVAAHEQLRAYGRILGVPVHTAHDRASLEDLLDLLSGKRMVLIDTAGMAQRDSRTRELLEMLSHRAIQKLLVVNASAQGETIEDQLGAYAAASCRGVVLSKLDEAVKLGPALDAMIRHKLRVLAVANGQRVPEDWHRLGAAALVQRALKSAAMPAWRVDECDVNLIFAGLPALPTSAAGVPLNA
jgi:flagellar biosynthesis protein FlhF